ncbi:MAG: ATP-binding cassette domain-containing protein, partial [Cyanobacteria bacterium J06648_10]
QIRCAYPEVEMSDIQDLAVLEQVKLPELIDRFGGLDTVEEWGDVLSLGEQQRLSFARVLVHQPAYTILDEATSALDRENEQQLYGHLSAAQIAYVSVGHRDSLKDYHKSLLRLAEDHSWELS